MTLDEKITYIFNKLIESGTKYIVGISCYPLSIKYKINEINITLCGSNYVDEVNNQFTTFEQARRDATFVFELKEDSSKIQFEIFINHNKRYIVPEMSRVEHAKAMTDIENIIAQFEDSQINNIMSELIDDSL